MSREIKKLLKMSVGTREIKTFRVYDLNGSADFMISSATFELRERASGLVALYGSATPNNAAQDAAGNTIKTVTAILSLNETDVSVGSYYLLIGTELSTGQTDTFRFPVEIVDYSLKGVTS